MLVAFPIEQKGEQVQDKEVRLQYIPVSWWEIIRGWGQGFGIANRGKMWSHRGPGDDREKGWQGETGQQTERIFYRHCGSLGMLGLPESCSTILCPLANVYWAHTPSSRPSWQSRCNGLSVPLQTPDQQIVTVKTRVQVLGLHEQHIPKNQSQ